VGESWEIADLPESIPDGRNRIADGPFAGRTLRELLERDPVAILGRASPADDGGFPLLIKFLDADENLSVQVHPTVAYAKAHPGAHLKTEAWIILHAEPGAVIYKGLRPGVTREDFAAHLAEGRRVVEDLVAVPVTAGECHYLPSGTVHALGAGVLAAEVQTPSDTTFRVYDWDRGRELHVEAALDCIDFSGGDDQAGATGPGSPLVAGGMVTTRLCSTDFFTVERIQAQAAATLPVVTNELPVIWMMTAGAGVLETCQGTIELAPGTTVLFPAATRAVTALLHPGAAWLQIAPPDPNRNLLA
jgi:mannose-6-phosphate isomerase